MPAGQVEMSIDELIQTLKRTRLATVIVEGAEDIVVYRRLEQMECKGGGMLSVLPVGGRGRVLELFKRRNEFTGKKVSYIADSDCWVVMGIPDDMLDESLVFTNGYSIENDLFSDADFESLLLESDKPIYRSELNVFIRWFALALKRHFDGNPIGAPLATHPNAILDDSNFLENAMKLAEGEVFPDDLLSVLSGNYARYLRGKSLMAILLRRLSYSGRMPRHHHLSLLEIGAIRNGPNLSAIYEKIRRQH